MKYGFFGGSFNPPTNAHLEIAKEALNNFNLDKVFFVPMGNSYTKPDLIDEKQRYEMLKIISTNENKIEVEDIELNQPQRLYAMDAFKMIENKYSDSENYYIMGADNFIKIPSWDENEKLIKNFKYIVFERNEINVNEFIDKNEMFNDYKSNIFILKLKQNSSCSSGMVRTMLKGEKYYNIENYINYKTLEYIKKMGLYK